MNTNSSKIGVTAVLKYFWRALKPQKSAAFFVMFAFLSTSTINILVPLLYKKFFDTIAQESNKSTLAPELVKTIIIVLILNASMWILYRTAMLFLNNLESKTMARIRQMSFDYMLKHSYSFFANNFSGSLVQRVGRFSRSFERLFDTLIFNIIPLIVYVIGTILIVWQEAPLISYMIMVWIGIIIIFSYFFSRWKLKFDLEAAKADTTTSAVLSDSISNQNTIASFAGFDKESLHFKETTNNQAKSQRYSWNLSSITDAVQAGFLIIVEFFLFYYAIKFWEKDAITIGTFVLIQVYILGLGHRLWDFSRIVRNTYESFADSKEMVEILETPYEIKDVPGANEIMVPEGKIEFKNVSFAFNETRTVLENISLEIKPGEKVALIGPSGAGKSTMVRLLLRMYDLTSGAIEVDGQNIKDVTQDSLRRNISLVPQDPILFHRTLMENIRYGKENATDEEVIEAAKLAHCHEFIDILPLKYETYVGERGIKLSGGERQRVAIARAILKNAPILILDEATSSLDSHSESLIQDALEKLMRGKTSIVVAHRLSTIRKMDRVVVIEDGKIVEEGSHDQLLSQEKSLYKNLWTLQAGGFLPE